MIKLYGKSILRQGVAIVMAVALIFTGFGGAINPSMAFGNEEAVSKVANIEVNNAISKTLDNYFKDTKKGVLSDWEEIAAVVSSGGNLEDFILPKSLPTGSPGVIANLIIGNTEKAKSLAEGLVVDGKLKGATGAYSFALDIIALEAYNRSAANNSIIVYDADDAIDRLLNLRKNDIFIDPFNGGSSPDDAGMVLIALSNFKGKSETVNNAIAAAVNQIKSVQTIDGNFEGAWGKSANSTALAINGLVAAGEELTNITTGESVKTPIDGLLSFAVATGGYWYSDPSIVDPYVSKQAAVAMADIKNNKSFYGTFIGSAINYTSVGVQVIEDGDKYTEAKLTLGADKSIQSAINKTLKVAENGDITGYNIYIGDQKVTDVNTRTIADGESVLAIASKYSKAAYFKNSETGTVGVTTVKVPFGGNTTLTLVEEDLSKNTTRNLGYKPISYGTAVVSGFGSTDDDGKITITPVEAKMEYNIVANRQYYDYNESTNKDSISADTAILPAKVVMEGSQSPQTANVGVRIEGPNMNILDTVINVVRTDGSRLTVHDAVTQALKGANIPYKEFNKYISSINNIEAGKLGHLKFWDGWMYAIEDEKYLNGTIQLGGMSGQFIKGGEKIVVYYGNDDSSTSFPKVSTELQKDGSVSIKVESYIADWSNGGVVALKPVTGASVLWGYTSGAALKYDTVTDDFGITSIPAIYAEKGKHPLQVEKADEGNNKLPHIVRLSPKYVVDVSAAGTSGGSEGAQPDIDKVSLAVKGPKGYLQSSQNYNHFNNMSPMSLLLSSGLNVSLSSDGSYVKAIEGVGEFDTGAKSGWLYSVNGTTPPSTPSKDYKLSKGDSVLWYYTLDYTKDSSSSQWTKENETPIVAEGKASATVAIEAKTDAKGEAKANVSAANISETLSKALEAAKKENKDGKKEVIPEVVIDVKAVSGTKSVVTTMPKDALNDILKVKGVITVNTPAGSLSFDGEALKALVEGAGGSDISLTMEIVENGKNPVIDEIKALEGRPVFNITANSRGEAIKDFKGGKVLMGLPYKLKNGEKGENLRITFISDDGKQEDLGSHRFDSVKGQVYGTSNHFSYYAITYKEANIQFTDVTRNDWFYNSVMNLANKGIVKGKSESKFEPLGNITRAEFVQILYNISGKSTATNNDFTDVKDGDWFSESVNWAASNKLVKGFENAFNPNANITRQDMSIILVNYIKLIEKKTIADKNLKITFNDEKEIADYAKEAVKEMANGGIINGIKNSDGSYSFKPENLATRGESATMISNYLQ